MKIITHPEGDMMITEWDEEGGKGKGKGKRKRARAKGKRERVEMILLREKIGEEKGGERGEQEENGGEKNRTLGEDTGETGERR